MTADVSSLDALARSWADTPEAHQAIFDACTEAVATVPLLAAHRDLIEQSGYGFGARAFHWVWYLIAQEWPQHYGRFLEIGVYRGQVLSLTAQLYPSDTFFSVGISPFDGRGLWTSEGWSVSDPLLPDLLQMRALFMRLSLPPFTQRCLPWPLLFLRSSTDPATVERVQTLDPFDAVYIDGSHAYEDVRQDLLNYAPMVKVGGLLIGDDSAWNLQLPQHHFRGFDGCSRAFDEILPPFGEQAFFPGTWTHVGNVMHLRIWRRLA